MDTRRAPTDFRSCQEISTLDIKQMGKCISLLNPSANILYIDPSGI